MKFYAVAYKPQQDRDSTAHVYRDSTAHVCTSAAIVWLTVGAALSAAKWVYMLCVIIQRYRDLNRPITDKFVRWTKFALFL